MSKETPVTVTLRLTRATKNLLQVAAEKDHRSMANMVAVLIHRHCDANGISVTSRTTKKSARS